MEKVKCDEKSYEYGVFDAYVGFEIKKSHRTIIKKFIEIIEDLKDSRFQVDLDSYAFFRKKILDTVNDETRNLEDVINRFKLLPKGKHENE